MADDTPAPSGDRTAAEYRAVADTLRNRVDLFGKTLAGLATVGTTAVGLNNIDDLFPGAVGWQILACLGLFFAALAAVIVAVRLMRAAGPVILQTYADVVALTKSEQKKVRPVLKAAAERFGYSVFGGLELKERALRNAVAQAVDPDEMARRTKLADNVKTEIDLALARAQVVVVRQRSLNAVSDWLAWALYVLVIAGLILFAVGADKVKSDRKDAATAKACADARTAGATADELKGSGCSSPDSALSAHLSDAVKVCRQLVAAKEGGKLTEADCKQIQAAAAKLKAAGF